jgi:hypothetical protein
MRKIGAGCSQPRLINEVIAQPAWYSGATAPTLPAVGHQLNLRRETPGVIQRSAIGTYERGSGPV